MRPLIPPTHTPLTDRAKVILAGLDRWLPAQLDQAGQHAYWQARHQFGPPAQGNARLFPHGPTVAIKLPVAGGGDDAHGHTRLEAIVRRVIIPAIKAGQMPVEQARQVQQELRGGFALLWREIDIALARKPDAIQY